MEYAFILPALVMMCLIIGASHANPGPAIHIDGLTPICTLNANLKKVYGYSLTLLSSTSSKWKMAQKQSLKMQIYAHIHTAKAQQNELQAIAAAYAKFAAGGLDSLKTTAEQAVKAAANSLYVAGNIDSVIDLVEGSSQTSGKECLGKGTAGGATKATGKEDLPGCETRNKKLEAATEQQALSAQDLKLAAKTSTPISGGLNQHCGLTSSQSHCLFHSALLDTKAIDFAGGLLKLSKTGVNLGKFDGSTEDRQQREVLGAAYDSTAALVQAATTATEAAGNLTLPQLIGQLKPQEALKRLEKNAKETAALLDERFGADGKKVSDDLWRDVEGTKVAKEAVEPDAETQLGKINDAEELISILAYYRKAEADKLSFLRKEVDKLKQKIQESSKTTKQICNEKTDAEKCNAEKHCKYNETKKKGQNVD
uniref:Variant surface glycoprotein 1125.4944 n=1 Tax=Trypanosoma brucei TaxID=5691 RepID=A0A1J0RBR1_9TRYP|nr:variant surface glycoprotein 1125.4944 [Trypanosoma brucei]